MPSSMICPRCWGSKHEPGGAAGCTYCHGQGTAAEVVLSPHFALSEMLNSPTAIRQGIPNNPPPDMVDHLRRLCTELLEPIRVQFGPLHVNSGLRLPALNAAIGGSSGTSAHQVGWAADFVPSSSGVTLKQIVDWVAASSLAYDQIIYEGTWVHAARFHPDGQQVRKQKLMMFQGHYSPYDPHDPRVL